MPKVFISYRRDDSGHIAARMHDRFVEHFGASSIFFDIDSIPVGSTFTSQIEQHLQKTDVVIAVIGKKWSSITFDRGPKAGQRRLDDAEDHLRIELETAIARNVPIFPVLVSGASMPGKEELPESLKSLVQWNAREISDGRGFRSSMESLFHELKVQLKIPYEEAKEMVVRELKLKIEPDGEFNPDTFKLAVAILKRCNEAEGQTNLRQMTLFTSGRMDAISFVTWLTAVEQRIAKVKAEAAAQSLREEEETKRQQTEKQREASRVATLMAQAELEKRIRDAEERKLKAEIERLDKKLNRTESLSLLKRIFGRRTLRSPKDVETMLKLPLFISMPHVIRPKRVFQRLVSPANTQLSEVGDPWSSLKPLRAYYGGLRERLIVNFEVRNLTHNPKLVAITSCGKGAGVSSIAAGLAASLSETGEGNVLLVDMNGEEGAAHQFYKGKPGYGLDAALEAETMNNAMISENLYVASETANDNGSVTKVVPKRFASLIPKLKASDYEYIIFDMPAVSQTNMTPRLAGLMDMVLLVIESGKTNTELAKAVVKLMAESRANVSAVLNKFGDL